MKAVKSTKGILLEPKPAVLIGEFGDSAITIKVKAWVDSKSGWIKIKSNLTLAIKKLFDEHNVTIPWPIRTVVEDKDQNYTEKLLQDAIVEEVAAQPGAPEAAVTATTQVAPVPQGVPVMAEGTPQVMAQAQVAQPVTVPIEETQDQGLKPLNEQR